MQNAWTYVDFRAAAADYRCGVRLSRQSPLIIGVWGSICAHSNTPSTALLDSKELGDTVCVRVCGSRQTMLGNMCAFRDKGLGDMCEFRQTMLGNMCVFRDKDFVNM